MKSANGYSRDARRNDMDGAAAIGAINLPRSLAERAFAVTYDALPEPVRELARQCGLDYLGVGLAGADDELVRILIEELAEAGGSEPARGIGHVARLPVPSASLVNRAICHALGHYDKHLAISG